DGRGGEDLAVGGEGQRDGRGGEPGEGDALLRPLAGAFPDADGLLEVATGRGREPLAVGREGEGRDGDGPAVPQFAPRLPGARVPALHLPPGGVAGGDQLAAVGGEGERHLGGPDAGDGEAFLAVGEVPDDELAEVVAGGEGLAVGTDGQGG